MLRYILCAKLGKEGGSLPFIFSILEKCALILKKVASECPA